MKFKCPKCGCESLIAVCTKIEHITPIELVNNSTIYNGTFYFDEEKSEYAMGELDRFQCSKGLKITELDELEEYMRERKIKNIKINKYIYNKNDSLN